MEREQMWILLFSLVMILSAAEQVENLTATEGGHITLPDPLMEVGFLLHERKNIAMVAQQKMEILDNIYRNKLLWNQTTGHFTITDLQRNDSGIYTLDSKKGRVFTKSYKLTVYECVPAPAVNTLSVSSESCTLLCFVDKTEVTTLQWYKEEEIVNQSSSALSLPLTVHKQDFNSSYRCVASSPAENKTLSVSINAFCGQNDIDTDTDTNRHYIVLIVVPIVFAVSVVLVALIIKQKYLLRKRTVRETQGPEGTETRDVLYTDVQICENRRSQQVEDLTESSGTVYTGSNLKTVYDKLEAHRMVSDYTELNDNVQD